ncbi:lipocalin-like domain-containing protein [Sphingobium estronivorans]|uniref:lipocalin-like domain-containing protein n=1 Tax=Sphingobium estronivorans TaxID=1577690 RepID=UPI001238FBA1|nr:lipocalin-like domain-containing protein [Sphingobium estronivorans]
MGDREKFVGAWQLVLWTTHRADGTDAFPFGRDAIGQIMYSADGHMSCHLMMANRPPLGTFTIDEVKDAALGTAVRAYSGYFGAYTVDDAAGIVTHHVDGAWYPDWTGSQQPRRFRFEGDRLFLEAEVGGDLVSIEWRRA